MSDFKAILEELLITEQRLGTLCDSSAAIYGGVNSLLTESLGDGPSLRFPGGKLLGLPPKCFLGTSLARIPIADEISRLNDHTNELRRVVQAALELLPKQDDEEGVQEDRETARKCLTLCDKVDEAAGAEYRKQLPLCIKMLHKAIENTDDWPMALRHLQNRLEPFESALSSLKQAEVDNPTGLKIPLHTCLRECQGLLEKAADLENVAQIHIIASTFMFELYENTMRVVLAITDPHQRVPKRMIRETIIDHKNQRAIFEEQIATCTAEVVATIEQAAALRLSFTPKDLGDLSALPLMKLCSIQKDTVIEQENLMAEFGKHLKQMKDSMSSCHEKIMQSEQGIETTNQCIRICEEALKVVNDDAEDFEVVSAEVEVEDAVNVAVRPYADTVEGFSGSVFDEFLRPYFLEKPRVVRKGEDFEICRNGWKVQFRVIETVPDTACVVNGGTSIHCEGQSISRGNLLDQGMPCSVRRTTK